MFNGKKNWVNLPRSQGRLGQLLLSLVMLFLVAGIALSGALSGTGPAASQGSGPLMSAPGAGVANPADVPYAPPREHILANGGKVSHAVRSDVSPPLKSIKPGPLQPIAERQSEVENGLPQFASTSAGKDPVLQDFFTLGPGAAMPSPLQNFDGLYNYWGGIPPDTVGEIGPNHYVEMVNVGFEIYSRSGASLYGPANFNTLFTGFGGLCETRNNGDPIVMYDQLADRWILTQFTAPPGPYYECIAVSTSGDPTGSYYRYAFQVSATSFQDYPHFGVWPDAYYMTTNEFANGTTFNGAGNFAFERQKMLVGDPNARFIYFNLPLPNAGLLPSDLDGTTLPPPGAPNYFVELWRTTGNELKLFKFDITTWDPAPVAALVGPVSIPVAPYDWDICTVTREACVDQPNGAPKLETLSDRLMFRLAYRNFGTHESLVVNHTVDANGAGRTGVRWYELRDPNGTPFAHQQSTYSPDSLHRWMGSVAMDRMGNLAVGYSTSSTGQYPAIRYAGRLATDPLSVLAQGEAILFQGTGVQLHSSGRWGDYTDLTVDPLDDCTFWYVNEYYSTTGDRNWRTRIGSFRFPNCTGPAATATPAGTPFTPTPVGTATATPCAGGQTFTGAITSSDPQQVGRLNRDGIPSQCGTTKACPGAADSELRRYDSYNFTNSSNSTQCITVQIASSCGDNHLLSTAYLGSFNPNNVCANYLADMGLAGPTFSYSFSAGPGASYVVVVNEGAAGVGCANYTLSVNPCAVGTPIPTATGTPPTATNTATTIPTNTNTATRTNTPTNTATATATATPTPLGCGASMALAEGFESGTLGAFHADTALGTFPWSVTDNASNSGRYSAQVVDPNEQSDQRLTLTDPVVIPSSATEAELQFAHRYSFEDATTPWDGGVLEYSTDGTLWTDAGSLITQGSYTGVITATAGNPLAGRPAWTNNSPGYPAFTGVTANLISLKGQTVRLRYRFGSDLNTGGPGWWVDDVRVLVVQPCLATWTPTVTPTSTSTPTNTPTATPAPDFQVSVSPLSATVRPGRSTSFTVTVRSLHGFSGNVTLSEIGRPANTTATFSANPVFVPAGGSANSTLTINTGGNTPQGTYTVTVTGTNGGRARSQQVTLIVRR